MRSNSLHGLRPAHAAAGALALVVPGSAVALAATQPNAPGAMQITLEKHELAYRGELVVSGSAAAADAGHIALLQFAQTGRSSWRTVGSSTIHADGSFRLAASLRRSGSVRVTDPGPAGARSQAPSTSTASTGGTPAPSAAQPVFVDAQFDVASGPITELGSQAAHVRGKLLPAVAGRRVTLVGRSGNAWRTLARARTGAGGRFDLRVSRASASGERLRVRFAGDRINATASAYAGRLTVLHPSTASWYDDSGTTACGFHAGDGVANRTLPCGTKVTFYYGGRTVTAVVDDRGPFVGGRDWDLNQGTASALGFTGVDTVWTSM
jgi:peptidoglycan lytic transglycosylase